MLARNSLRCFVPVVMLVMLTGSIPALANKPVGGEIEGWTVEPADNAHHWKMEDGEIYGENEDKKGSILWTDEEYVDFEVTMEYRTPSEDYDSGVFTRGNSHQVQIGISRSLQKDLTACIYAPRDQRGSYPAQSDKVAEVHKLGEWNKLRIVVVGKRIQTFLNDVPFVDYEAVVIPEKGRVGLQLHGNVHMKMQFRNVEIKALESDGE